MKWSPILLLLALLLCFAGTSAAAATPLTAQLPSDTQVVLLVRDITTISPRWQAGALGRAGADPQIQKFLAPIQDSFKELFEDGSEGDDSVSFEEFLEPLSGISALIIPDISRLDNDSGESGESDTKDDSGSVSGVLFLADVADEKVLTSLMERDASSTQEKVEEGSSLRFSDEEFLGALIHKQEWFDEEGEATGSAAWSVEKGQFLFGDPELVRAQLERMSKGVDETLADRSEIRSLMAHAPNADIWLMVALDRIVPALVQQAEEEAAEAIESPSGPFGDFDPRVVFEALGLDALEGAAMAITFEPAETSIDMVVTYSENRGLMKVIAYKPGPVKYPKFIPSHAYEAAVVNFSFAEMWEGVREIVTAFSPEMATMFDAQLAQMKEATGFDLEKNLIGSLGETIFVASFLPEAENPGEDVTDNLTNMQQVMGFAVEDAEAFDAGLETLIALLSQAGPGFREVEYLDHVFYELTQPQTEAPNGEDTEAAPQEQMAFAHAGGYLLLSVKGTEPLRAILARMAEPGKTIWQEKKIRASLKHISADASAVSVSSTFELGQLMLNGFMQGLVAAGDEEDPIVDPESLPEAETFAKYFDTAVNGVYKTDSEIRIVWKLLSTE